MALTFAEPRNAARAGPRRAGLPRDRDRARCADVPARAAHRDRRHTADARLANRPARARRSSAPRPASRTRSRPASAPPRAGARALDRSGGSALIGDTEIVTADGEREVRPRPAPRPGPRAGARGAGRARSRAAARRRSAGGYLARRRWRGRRRQDAGRAVPRRLARSGGRAQHSRRFRALVLVPTEGLRRLCRLLADRLQIEKLEIAVIDHWLIERAHAAFPGLPKRARARARPRR